MSPRIPGAVPRRSRRYKAVEPSPERPTSGWPMMTMIAIVLLVVWGGSRWAGGRTDAGQDVMQGIRHVQRPHRQPTPDNLPATTRSDGRLAG